MPRFSKPSTALSISLSIAGIALVVAALLIMLNGLGILESIPRYIIGGLILLVLGFGILGGLRNAS